MQKKGQSQLESHGMCLENGKYTTEILLNLYCCQLYFFMFKLYITAGSLKKSEWLNLSACMESECESFALHVFISLAFWKSLELFSTQTPINCKRFDIHVEGHSLWPTATIKRWARKLYPFLWFFHLSLLVTHMSPFLNVFFRALRVNIINLESSS